MLGEELRGLRLERGLNPADLHRLSGVSRQHIYAIEGGQNTQPYPKTLLKLASGLSAWRGGKPDPDECADVFHRLQVAAGYPVDAPQVTPDGETVATPIPQPLAESILEILENWPRWSQPERDTAARLLDVASDIGRPDSPTVAHEDPSQSQNGITGFVSIISRLIQEGSDGPGWVPSRIAPTRTRELVHAGR